MSSVDQSADSSLRLLVSKLPLHRQSTLLVNQGIILYDRANQIFGEAAGEPEIDMGYFLVLNQGAEISYCIDG